MGIENRDYTRDSDYTGTLAGFGLDYVSPVVKWLIAANVIVFVLQIFVTREPTPADAQAWLERLPKRERQALDKSREQLQKMRAKQQAEDGVADQPLDEFEDLDVLGFPGLYQRVSLVQEWLQLDSRLVAFRGQVWRLVSYAFCHERFGVWHILFNMLVLFWAGVTLESMYGPREFLLFYLVAAVGGAAAQIGLDLYLGSNIPAIGASGAVMAVGMLYALHYPRNTIRVFWFWPVEIRWIMLLYVVYNLHPLLLALGGDQVYTGTAYAVHLGGLGFGFLYWKFQWNLERVWDRVPRPRGALVAAARSRSAPQPPRRSPEKQFDEEVDAVLQKISQSGADSLTPHERRVLELASQRYKRRRGS